MPPITQTLIIVNTAVFLLQLATGHQLVASFALWPLAGDPSFGPDPGGGFRVWQLVTYSFLHGGIAHLFFNMFALYMFGSELERLFGPRFYLAFYLACVITAGIAQLLVAAMTSAPPYPTVGASGGVFGLLLAFGMYFPRRTIMLIFPPIPMPAWLFVTLYGLLTLYMGITGAQPGVAHFAHLGGMLGGYLMIQHRRGRFPFGGRRRG